MKTYKNFINGRFASDSSAHIDVINPATEAVISRVPASSDQEVDAAVSAAAAAQNSWEKLPPIERAGYLRKISALIRERVEELARVISEEQGKVLPLSRVEVEFTANYIDYMAEWARRIEGEIIPSDRSNEHIFLFRKAIGVVAGILPWNFPFFLIARKMAPALVTGNTIVIKPSEETPNNAFEFAKLVEMAGLPPGVVNFVSGLGATVGHRLASHTGVGMISFTGSVGTGSKIMADAAKNITKVNLELGGKAPAIVMGDASIDLAVQAVKASRILNSGQVCNCAERVYVHRKIADEFTSKLAASMSKARYGNPFSEGELDYGPLINQPGLAKVQRLVDSAVAEGAQVVSGGKRAHRDKGFYYEPTVLSGCRHDMTIIREEIFGPVVPVVAFDDMDQVIAYANDSEYGLTSSIYTNDLNLAMRACRDLHFGETYINRENFEAMQGYHAGWRKSGIGGADGRHGINEYTQTHTVYVQFKETK